MTQPSDDNVTEARLKGFAGGIGEGLLDFFTPSVTDIMPDPTMGLAPVASAIGNRPLKQVAPEAYQAVKGLKGLYSRLTDAVAGLPDRVFPSKLASAAKSGASAEEASIRGFGDFLAGRDPNKVIPKEEVLSHLEANPINLEVKTLQQTSTNRQNQLKKRLTNGPAFPGPETFIARLTPEMKEMIKKVGFPAMAALMGLRMQGSPPSSSESPN